MRWIYDNELATIETTLADNPGYSLHVFGHSLGGGTAAILAVMLRDSETASRAVRNAVATTVASPACASQELAEKARGYVASLVTTYDVIPRACIANWGTLMSELGDSDWQKEVMKERLG